MTHSTLTSKGQTTIPGEIRAALKIKLGDKLEYSVAGNHITMPIENKLKLQAQIVTCRHRCWREEAL
jgi:AbrB family looped-hinge helix DNA binding protein